MRKYFDKQVKLIHSTAGEREILLPLVIIMAEVKRQAGR